MMVNLRRITAALILCSSVTRFFRWRRRRRGVSDHQIRFDGDFGSVLGSLFDPIEQSLRGDAPHLSQDRKSTRLNSSHSQISYAVFCLKKKKKKHANQLENQDRKRRNELP